MFLNNKITLLLLPAMLLAPLAFGGREAGNGGDPCENRIQQIRDDIVQWVQKGGSRDLRFTGEMTLEKYNSLMATTWKAAISCQDETIKIGSAAKICKNLFDEANVPRIVCDRKAFLKDLTEEEQYELVHHEYAGLAGLETNQDEKSNYSLSRQISAFLQVVKVKKLAIHRQAAKASETLREGSYGTYGRDLCGFHVEKNGEQLLFTWRPNPAFENPGPCGVEGATFVLKTDAKGRYTIPGRRGYYGVPNGFIYVKLLEDGNFLLTDIEGNAYKYMWWNQF